MRPPLIAVWLLALGLAACGGGPKDPADRPTATPTPTPKAEATPEGVDVKAINGARDDIVAACKTLAGTGGDRSAALADLKTAVGVYQDAFKAAPDSSFKRSTNTPAVTMRKLLLSSSGYLRSSCGDEAKGIGRRLRRMARAGSSS